MKKYFREVERGVFTPFLENGTTFVCQGRFLKFFRGVSFFSPHISPSQTAVLFFLSRGCSRFWPKFRCSYKNHVFLPKIFFFLLSVFIFTWGSACCSRGVMFYLICSFSSLVHISLFPPTEAPVPGAVIVHADIFVVFCVYFVHKTYFFVFFFAIVFSFSCVCSAR